MNPEKILHPDRWQSLPLFHKGRLTAGLLLFCLSQTPVVPASAASAHHYASSAVNRTTERSISGTVTDENNSALPGVTILIKGTSRGTTSDVDGKFTLSIPENENVTLTLSFVGYETQELPVQNRSVFTISLQPSLDALDEVVVIGYGAVRKKDLTGSVVQLKSEQLKEVPTQNVLEAVQGKIAGADITRSSGQAGSGVNIRIRGNRSIGGNNAPLIIVDGVQYGSLEDINSNDIESMEVLKDASSIAIYGSRGANGVILITTKKGKSGRPDISFNSYAGVSQVTLYPKPMDMIEYRDFRREAWRATGDWNSAADDNKIFMDVREYDALQRGEWIDYHDELFRNGLQQNYQLGIRGGSDRLKSYASIDYFNEKGVLKMDEVKRYTARLNLDYTINDWMNIGMQSQLTFYDQSIRRDPLNQANKINGFGTIYDEEGNFRFMNITGQFASPLADEQPNVFKSNALRSRILTNGYIEIKPFKGLTARSTLGVNLNNTRTGTYASPQSIDRVLNGKSLASVANDNSRSINWENVVTYQKSLDQHNFTLTGIASYLGVRSDEASASGVNQLLSSQLFYSLASATEELRISSGYSRHDLLSVAGRLNYGFRDRYLITLTARKDGSSKLAPGNKWTFFPSAAVAWRIIEEDFLQNVKGLSDLKLRASYGIAGNDPSGPYATQTTLQRMSMGFDDLAVPAYTYSRNVGNAGLGWELSRTTNIGLDVGLFNGRVNAALDYYDTRTTDLLLDRGLPPTTGVTTVKQNIGKTRNHGIELNIASTNISNGSFTWNSNLTFSRNRESITELVTDGDDIGNGWFIGQPIQVFYDYEKVGIWQTNEAQQAADMSPAQAPGHIKVKDQNGDGRIDAANDRVILGNPRPKWSGGLDNTFKYKGFDLNIMLYARMGQMIDAVRYGQFKTNGIENSISGMDYWTPENPTNAYPRPNRHGNVLYLSTLRYQDGSFARVRNITLAYNLPVSKFNWTFIKGLRVYATAKNPITFTKLNYDPERGGSESFPMTKVYVFGLNLNL